MAADKEIMKAIERLRLDRPGRTYQANSFEGGLDAALRELAATYREEAELWAKSGAKGWKGSEAENYLIAQAVDTVAAQLDNAGGGAALSVSQPEPVGQTAPATTHERLDDLVSAAVAEGRGMLREVAFKEPLDISGPTAEIQLADGSVHDVTAYLKGEVSTLPGLAEALVPGSVTDGTVPEPVPPYCGDCDHDTHRCYGCGEPVGHGKYACAQCELIHADGPPVTDATATDDPEFDAMEARVGALPVPPPITDCTHGADCPVHPEVNAVHNFDADSLPKTWESETLTADGFVKPGVAQTLAPTLGQPGDNSGGGYSHDYVPPGGRRLTYADLLQPVAAASLPAHLSHSQGNTIGDCATKYRLQRVEQLPQIPQWANIGGTAFHAAVEALERTIVNHPSAPDVGLGGIDVELSWKHWFDGEISAVAATTTVPRSVWRSSRKGAEGEAWWWVNGPKFLRAYLDARPDESTTNLPNPAGEFGPGMFQSAIEIELTFDVPTPYGPIPFTAKLDRVTDAPHVEGDNWKTLVIRDYKTSYERPTDTTQLGDYAWALKLGLGVPDSVRILGSYFDARRGTWTEPVDLLAAHPFEAFQYNVTSRHAQKRALTTGPTPARPSSFCGGCSVRYACPVMASKG
jgi:hypothetical protein